MATRSTVNGVAEPKQRRSRDSFAKVRSAVLQLLQERGNGQFSIAEVSAAAGLSIGSIYGRVASKADLLRVVQSEEFDRLDTETEGRVSNAGVGAQTFEHATTAIVTAISPTSGRSAITVLPARRRRSGYPRSGATVRRRGAGSLRPSPDDRGR